jgi:hypothetical protein
VGTSSDDDDVYKSFGISANFGVGFLPLLGEPGGKLQQDSGLFAEERSSVDTTNGESADVGWSRLSLEIFLLFLDEDAIKNSV